MDSNALVERLEVAGGGRAANAVLRHQSGQLVFEHAHVHVLPPVGRFGVHHLWRGVGCDNDMSVSICTRMVVVNIVNKAFKKTGSKSVWARTAPNTKIKEEAQSSTKSSSEFMETSLTSLYLRPSRVKRDIAEPL